MIAPSLPSLLVSHWHPSGVPDLAVAAAAALYLGGMARIHTRWPLRRTAAFLAGLACILVATDSGIGAYDDRSCRSTWSSTCSWCWSRRCCCWRDDP